ncbi:nuclear transport factor 2 family protein [Nonomuraea sp. NPDC049684]|uniref:nuclear transport factor 2 family protein n=1 Tax=unclassified Nonomuraea TaxID=2593643 RepID=UPI003792A479
MEQVPPPTNDIVRRLLGAANAHDVEAMLRCYAPDAVVVSPEMEAGGPGEIASYFTQIWDGFPDLHFTLWETVMLGGTLATELTATGTHSGPYLTVGGEVLAATGRQITVRACWFWDLRDGLVASQRLYYDQLEIYAQIGLCLPLSFEPPDPGHTGAAGVAG